MNNIKLSIIVPLYNKEAYIESCIESIINLKLDESEYEAIFIDDKSTDKSVEIVQNYVERFHNIKLMQLEENTGSPAQPRNIGIEHARGTYISLLDADDWLDIEGVPKILEELIRKDADIGFGKSLKHTENSITIIGKFQSYKQAYGFIPYELDKVFRAVGPPGKVFKKKIVTDNKIVFKHMKYGEDKLFFVELISRCHYGLMVDYPIYHINRFKENQSLVKETDINQKSEYNLLILEEIIKMNIPKTAKENAISRIIEVDFLARLFNRKRFLKMNGIQKEKSIKLYQDLIILMNSNSIQIEQFIQMPHLKIIHQLLKNLEYGKLIQFIDFNLNKRFASHYINHDNMFVKLPEELNEFEDLIYPIYPIYKGVHDINKHKYIKVYLHKLDSLKVDKVIAQKIGDENLYKGVSFEVIGQELLIHTDELKDIEFNYNLTIIYDGYKSSMVYASYPFMGEMEFSRQNYKLEITEKKDRSVKQEESVTYINECPVNVITKKRMKLYRDVDFTEDIEDIIIGTLIEIKGIENSSNGTPRLKTNQGFYITANLNFVSPFNNLEESNEYYNEPVNKVKIIKECKMYDSPNFKGEALRQLSKGEKIYIKDIKYSAKGTPRLYTKEGYFITANKQFVKHVYI